LLATNAGKFQPQESMNYYSLDNAAAHNAARTRQKQQLLQSFSQIKIHLFFHNEKFHAAYTELATFLVFWLLP